MEHLLIGLLVGLALLAAAVMGWLSFSQWLIRRDKALRQRWQAELQAAAEQRLQDQKDALSAAQTELKTAQTELQAAQSALQAEKDTLSGLSPEAARAEVLAHWQSQLESNYQRELALFQERLRNSQTELARDILSDALQRAAASHAQNHLALQVRLPDNSFRGRVIGKAGRNIETLQEATGAGFALDDESPVVWVSAFDPRRREVARRTLEALLGDGRIYPDRIQEEARRQAAAVEAELPELGRAAAESVGVRELHPEICKVLGMLHYRQSYGQNVLLHAQECARLAASLAEALGADIALARRAALLHDLGKALVHADRPESHAELGADLARRCGESPAVIHAMSAHHNEVPPQTLEAVIVQLADTLSAARPGARSSAVNQRFERLQQLEALAKSFDGVEQAWVLRAGQELRVIVDPDQLSEAQAQNLSRELASAIAARFGRSEAVKVSVLRQLQFSDFS